MAPAPSTTDTLPIERIEGPMVFLKDKTLRAVLEVSAINFELRSSDEQIALLQQFQGFLNSVDFKFQIVIQSRKFDIEIYLKNVEESVATIENAMLKTQADEYVRFIRELSDLSNIMGKKFYVVIPLEVVAKAESKGVLGDLRGMFSRKKKGEEKADTGPSSEQMQTWAMQLNQRADLVASGLSGMGLKATLLDQDALIALFTELYNPEIPASKEPTPAT